MSEHHQGKKVQSAASECGDWQESSFAVGPVHLAIPDGVSRNLGRPLAPDSCRASMPRISIQILRTSPVGQFPRTGQGHFADPLRPLSLWLLAPANTLILRLRAMSAGWRFFSAVGFVATGPILFDPFGQ
jgi:hypothetical protein